MEYSLTWKVRTTPAARTIYALRASTHRTSAKDCIGWRTPNSTDGERGDHPSPDTKAGQHSLTTEASVAGWPTPNTPTGGPNSKRKERGAGGPDLDESATLAGWPTPAASEAGVSEEMVRKGEDDQRKYGAQKVQIDLARKSQLAGWPTPNSMEGGQTSRGGDRKDEPLLGGIVKLCGWQTPNQSDIRGPCKHHPERKDGGQPNLHHEAKLSGWATPQAADQRGKTGPASANKDLGRDAAAAGWATPAERDYRYPNAKSYQERTNSTKGEQLANQVVHHGPMPSGTPAEMESGAALVLNPRFSLWLLGFPLPWAVAGLRGLRSLKAQATPSSRPSPPNS